MSCILLREINMWNNYKHFRVNWLSYVVKRWKSKSERKLQKKTAKDKALEHFDDFYKPIFGNNWPSIRSVLLSESKYVAILNNYSDIEAIKFSLENIGAINIRRLFEIEASKVLEKKSSKRKKINPSKDLTKTMNLVKDTNVEEKLKKFHIHEEEKLNDEHFTCAPEQSDRYIDPSVSTSQLYEYIPTSELIGSEDWVPESQYYSYYPTKSDLCVNIIKETNLRIPENLHVYSFEPGNTSPFLHPKKGKTGVSDYYLMDGGSILPVLALDVQPNDQILDMCAAPGGKSFICLQTLLPKCLVCNDVSESRSKRIWKVMYEFFYDIEKKISNGEIEITCQDARKFESFRKFNKILVDVPCTTDRRSVTNDDNNIFKSSRLKERIRIPELQSQILMQALKLVIPGGTVVYSTCSLSPIQNEGVVHMALQNISEETDSEFLIVDMEPALEQTKVLFSYGNIGLRYGHLIIPNRLNNFGPTYFCKILKVR